jgi:hypothetical protein
MELLRCTSIWLLCTVAYILLVTLLKELGAPIPVLLVCAFILPGITVFKLLEYTETHETKK